MDSKGLGTNVVCQGGLIVEDIERSIWAYSEILGLEPTGVMVTGPEEEAHTRYRGEATPARAKLAFFDTGQAQIELIQPLDGPSTWRDFLEEKGEGVHHIAFVIKGTDEVVARLDSKGVPVVQQGDYTGGRYTYVDSAPQLGVILELLENF